MVFHRDQGTFIQCMKSANEHCIWILYLSGVVLVAFVISSVTLSILCCVQKRRRTPSHQSDSLPYHTFSDNRRRANNYILSMSSSLPKMRRKSADGYTKVNDQSYNVDHNREGTMFSGLSSDPYQSQSDGYSYAGTVGKDRNESTHTTRVDTGLYAYARASDVTRIAADSDSDDEVTTRPLDKTFSSLQSSQWSGDVQVSLEYTEVTEQVFCKPPSSEKALFASFLTKKYNIISKKAVRSQGEIGTGEFGTVLCGQLNTTSGIIECAIKKLHEGFSLNDKVKFLQEADIIGQFNHPQIVKLYGVVLEDASPMIVLELLPLGDLRQYLLDLKLKTERPPQENLQRRFLSYARQVAEGMQYLASKNFIHRDLAARNILMANEDICKIGDFGLSRDLVDEEFYLSKGGQIPIKWTAIEAIEFRQYSLSSDVWSYGVLLFEIWSMGEKPFRWMAPPECLRRLKSGERLHPPPGCPRPIYHLMMECWHPDPAERLSFPDIIYRFTFGERALLDMGMVSGSEESFTLGARLCAGEKLYPDIQKKYIH